VNISSSTTARQHLARSLHASSRCLLDNVRDPRATSMKHIFTVVGLGMAGVFVAVFFTGRMNSRQLDVVAPRVGMKAEALNALAPRISSQTGATMGTSRRVVYLLACSGVPTRETMESQAIVAALMTEKKRLTAREATKHVLTRSTSRGAEDPLRDC
jgi:hypothetical protein